jgi:hypothetical protein
MKLNIFLDDERFPNPSFGGDQMSAYDLTGNKKYFLLDWIIVRNFGEFVKIIEKILKEHKEIGTISFDHDLKDDHYYHYHKFTVLTGWIDYTVVEGTGLQAAKWLTEHMMNNNISELPEILIHTQNKVGARNIKNEFENFKKHML